MLSSAVAAAPRYSGEIVAMIADAAGDPLRMPSDLAVAPDGSIYIADGVNDRVLQFGADGAFLRAIVAAGADALHRPLGIAAGADGLIWIADTGNGRIVALDAEQSVVHEFHPPPQGERPVDLTDLAVDPVRGRVWFADNNADQIGYCALASGAVTRFGSHGAALGQMHYPYGLALGRDGDIFVSDVLNGRVQLFNRNGQPVGAIGRYGVALGDLYRPKGVALSADEEVWISDSRLGVIQIFRPTGECLGVLADASGAPLRFATPSGLGFDAAGDLYVVELGADRIVRIAVRREATAPPPKLAPAHPTRQPRTCTACHVEWLAPFVDGKGTELGEAPENRPNDPVVARSENCLSCHDGAVVDSRERVWQSHGHELGQAPPPGMAVPARLPLVDGGVACRTCHSAHTRGGAGETIARAVFLRVDSSPAELCTACHRAQAERVGGGHVLADLETPLSDELTTAHAFTAGSERTMTCLTCHNAHGGREQLLLNLPGTESRLCLNCHSGYEGGGAHTGGHPIDVPRAGRQAGVSTYDGRRGGEGGVLVCSSCHAMHQPAQPDFLLQQPLADSALCRDCHVEQSHVLATVHNLERTHPDVTNAAGFALAAAGACSACHMVHQRAQVAAPRLENDPQARCTSCHAEGELAAQHSLTHTNHRGATCRECHNPHDDRHGDFLAQPADALCRTCHAEMSVLAGGPHDRATNAGIWPAVAQAAAGDCLACHRPHAGEDGGLYRAGVAAGLSSDDGACVQCHSEAGWNGAGAIAALHPNTAHDGAAAPGLPLGSDGALQCATCHNPHAAPATPALLRTAAGVGDAGALCVSCHTDMAVLHATAHDAAQLRGAGVDAAACGPCHQVHGDRSKVGARALWAAELRGVADSDSAATDDVYCTGCHRAGGPAAAPVIATHPDLPMASVRAGASEFPLFDTTGAEAAGGRMTCRTCHNPHGRAESRLPDQAVGLSPAELRGQHNLVRRFESPNLCTDCHGFEGYSRFLYFHDPQRRRGTAAPSQVPTLWMPRGP